MPKVKESSGETLDSHIGWGTGVAVKVVESQGSPYPFHNVTYFVTGATHDDAWGVAQDIMDNDDSIEILQQPHNLVHHENTLFIAYPGIESRLLVIFMYWLMLYLGKQVSFEQVAALCKNIVSIEL